MTDETPEMSPPKAKNRGGRPKKKPDPMVAELMKKLDAATALIQAQGETIAALGAVKVTAPQAAPQAPAAGMREDVTADLQELSRRRQWTKPAGDMPGLTPYSGMVQAREPCCIGCLRATGEIFHVDVPALWSDDPYVAVVVDGYTAEGKPNAKPNPTAPPQIDFRFRPTSADAMASERAATRTAAQYEHTGA